MTAPLERYRFTVREYNRMGEAGILGEGDRVELIEGEIVMMPPIGSRHAACVAYLNHFLVAAAGSEAIVRVQSPIVLDDHSEPEPDFCIAKPRADFYAAAHPAPADVLLLIEVADSSIGFDRGVKVPLYGRAGVPALWIVDLGSQRVFAYSEPSPDGFAQRRTFRAGESLPLPGLAGAVAVADLFAV
jgi:Uma2 family endonuclease